MKQYDDGCISVYTAFNALIDEIKNKDSSVCEYTTLRSEEDVIKKEARFMRVTQTGSGILCSKIRITVKLNTAHSLHLVEADYHIKIWCTNPLSYHLPSVLVYEEKGCDSDTEDRVCDSPFSELASVLRENLIHLLAYAPGLLGSTHSPYTWDVHNLFNDGRYPW